MDAARAKGKPPAAPPLTPCAIHGAVELWPQNEAIWKLYLTRISPLAVRVEYKPVKNGWQPEAVLDWGVVFELIRLYPLAPERQMVEQIQAIFDTLTA